MITQTSEKMDRINDNCKIGKWNMRGMQGNEVNVIQEFQRTNILLLGLTETNKKSKGQIELENWLMITLGTGRCSNNWHI